MRATSGGRSGISALKNSRSGYKINGQRLASNDRKSSVGGEFQMSDSHSPYPQKQSQIQFNKESNFNQALRNQQNQSAVTQGSVIVVDQEEQLNQQNQQELRNSSIGVMSGMKSSQNNMKLNVQSNATGDTIFKQVNSTTSNNGKSNQTQSTAYSVRTTSSGATKNKLGNLQSSQSPFTDGNQSN